MKQTFDLIWRSIVATLIIIFGVIFLSFCFLLDLGWELFHKIKRVLNES